MKNILGLLLLMLWSAAAFAAPAPAPVALWTSDPVQPGQTVLVFGDGFGGCRAVRWERLPDIPGGRTLSGTATPLQVRPKSVKFLLPASVPAGVFRATLATPSGKVAVWINRPQVLWTQGDQGRDGAPGGFVRVIGKCLQAAGRPASVRLQQGGRTVTLAPSLAEPFTLQVSLPRTLAPGDYELCVSSGTGGPSAWSEPVPVNVAAKSPAFAEIFPAPAAMGDAEGDTEAIQKALDQAGKDGGTVRLPAGRYLLNDGLRVPPHVSLRGAGMDRTALCWLDTETPPEALLKGSGHFAVDDLSLYAVNYQHGIVGDQTGPAAGHVRIQRVRMRLDPYRGHLTAEEVNARLLQAQKLSSGGGDSLRLGGPEVEVSGCDIYGAGRSIYLSRGSGVWIHDNLLSNGRWGWYCLSGNDGVIFERNTLQGGDLMSTGGGLNCLDGSMVSRNVYFAQNTLRNMFGWDREAMTTDAGGGAYYGRIAASDGVTLTLADDPKWNGRDWTGAGVFLLDGAGQGQFRQIVRTDGRRVTLDRPWQIAPDGTSVVTITMLQQNYLFVGNHFTDAGVAIQMYGTAVGNIASGNVSARTGGFHNFGMNYDGIEPSWYVQWLGNEITDGTVYGGGHDQSVTTGEAHLAVQCLPPQVTPAAPLTLCAVVRGNRLDSDAHLEVGLDPPSSTIAFPYIQEVVVEGNRVAHAAMGLLIGRAVAGVLARDNRFVDCAAGAVNASELDRQAAAQRKALFARPGPLLRLTFSSSPGPKFSDATGNGFTARCSGPCTVDPGGPHGGTLTLDGHGYVTVSHPAWLAMTDFTLGVWMKTDHLPGRWGLLSKRFAGTETPFILGEQDGRVFFEATDTTGKWSFNVQSDPVLTPGVWHHLAAVMRSGQGVTLYADGREVARRDDPAAHVQNDAPLILGHDAWGGDPARAETPAFFSGSLADVQIWPRALSPEEVARMARE